MLKLKLACTDTVLADLVLNPSSIARTEAKLSSLVENTEYNYEKRAELRQQQRSEVLKLQRAMNRVDERDLASLERTTLNDMRNYEKQIRAQLMDIMQIIQKLRQLVETEDMEIIYDLRNPLMVFESFFDQLGKTLKGIQLPQKDTQQIQSLLEEIEQQYEQLLDHTTTFIQKDLQYLQSLGLNFSGVSLPKGSPVDHARYLAERAKLKKQMNGKTQWIISQIQEIEQKIKDLKVQKTLPADFANHLLEHISYFKSQFGGLMQFCTARVDVANQMILESVALQKQNYEELESLKKEIKDFYASFFQEQQALAKTGTALQQQQAKKRISDFSAFQKAIDSELTSFAKSFEKSIKKTERADLKLIKNENRTTTNIVPVMNKLKGKMRKWVIAASAVLLLGGITSEGINIAKYGQSRVIHSVVQMFNKESRDITKYLGTIQTEGVRVTLDPAKQLLVVKAKHSDTTIAVFKARGGPEETRADPRHPGSTYAPTKAGDFVIKKTEIKPYANPGSSWVFARIKFGSLVREMDGEIQVNQGSGWEFATGPNAKIKGLTKENFYLGGILMQTWWKNPFGHLTIKIEGTQGQWIHSNVVGEITGMKPNFTQPISHGCIHIAPDDMDELARILNLSPDKEIPIQISYSS